MPKRRGSQRTLLICLVLATAAACRTPARHPVPPQVLVATPNPEDADAPRPGAAPRAEKKRPPKPKPKKVQRRPKAKRPPPTPVPKPTAAPLDLSFLASKTACALVFGGATVTEEEGVEVDLAQLNGAVTGAVYERLAALGHVVEPLVVFTRDSSDRKQVVAIELAKRRCNRVVQVSHYLQGPTFGFLVTVIQPATDQFDPSQDVWRFHWDPLPFTRRYAYRYTEDAVFELDPEDVAQEIAYDLSESELLARGRAP
ncbi:MAG TPA: hypothetical protein VEB43_10905 [Anaeromyxobacter sp.]|nr:hypothetical protein [Anaeromyxobacter sp.]